MGKLIKINNIYRRSLVRYSELDANNEEKRGQVLMFTGIRYERHGEPHEEKNTKKHHSSSSRSKLG